MEIQEIKERLTLSQVLKYYNLTPDRNKQIRCPFHNDKTPSLQVYEKTGTYNCFGCGANGDTIQFIQDFEKLSKHQAILRAKELLNISEIPMNKAKSGEKAKVLLSGAEATLYNGHTINNTKPIMTEPKENQAACPEQLVQSEAEVSRRERKEILAKAWEYFNKASKSNSKQLKDYLESRNLDPIKTELGYNSGQFHHRKPAELVKQYAKYNLLLPGKSPSKTGLSFTPWAKHCIIFPLKNKQNEVTSFYGRSIIDNNNSKHYYLKNRKGLYPNYPKPNTRKLLIPESIIDTATLIQIPEAVKAGCHTELVEVLASYGTNGITEEHKQAIKDMNELEEIILFFDGDQAGREAAQARAEELHEIKPGVKISIVATPENEDINSLSIGHEPELFTELIQIRKEIFSFSIEGRALINSPVDCFSDEPACRGGQSNEKKKAEGSEPEAEQSLSRFIGKPEPLTPPKPEQKNNSFDTSNPDYITYKTNDLEFALLGGISIKQLDRMRVTLRTSRSPQLSPLHSIRQNIDLYNDDQVEKYVRKTAERLEMGTSQINQPLYELIEKLEKHRIMKREEQKQNFRKPRIELTEQEKQEAIEHLNKQELIKWLKSQIREIGLVDEENNGMLLFLIFLTRNFKDPLHALVHGLSGSGKTHLLKSIIKLVPPEVVYTTTAITENVLFYPPYKEFWKHKILLLEDLDGSYSALLPLREFMSNQYISKLSTEHDPKTGEFKQRYLEAEGPICIAGATTKDKLYEDNANRSFIIHVNESKQHKNKVMEYQNKLEAGLINESKINDIANLVRNMQRMLRPIKIINPYALELKLPDYVFKPLRTNTHYLTLIRSITYLHQYQLPIKKTKQGTEYIETTLEHIEIANELSKELLLRKSDELAGQLRIFFESLKDHCKTCDKPGFFAKEIRVTFRYHPQKLKRYLDDLESRGYLRKVGGYKHKQGFEYEITTWDDYQILKDGINILDKILDGLKGENKYLP